MRTTVETMAAGVIFMNPQDMKDRGIRERQLVNITSHFEGQQRTLEKF